jgi:hypothetical protein
MTSSRAKPTYSEGEMGSGEPQGKIIPNTVCFTKASLPPPTPTAPGGLFIHLLELSPLRVAILK